MGYSIRKQNVRLYFLLSIRTKHMSFIIFCWKMGKKLLILLKILIICSQKDQELGTILIMIAWHLTYHRHQAVCNPNLCTLLRLPTAVSLQEHLAPNTATCWKRRMMRDQISRYYISQSMTRMVNLIKSKGCFQRFEETIVLNNTILLRSYRITPQAWIMFKETYNSLSFSNL